MRARLITVIAASALSASLFCLPAAAQTPPPPQDQAQAPTSQNKAGGPGMQNGQKQGMRGPRDCSKAPHPEQCKERQEALKSAQAACQSEQGPARRECMQAKMPPPDCSKAPDPQRCESRQKAREACKGKSGPEHKTCLREQLPAKPAPAPAPKDQVTKP